MGRVLLPLDEFCCHLTKVFSFSKVLPSNSDQLSWNIVSGMIRARSSTKLSCKLFLLHANCLSFTEDKYLLYRFAFHSKVFQISSVVWGSEHTQRYGDNQIPPCSIEEIPTIILHNFQYFALSIFYAEKIKIWTDD